MLILDEYPGGEAKKVLMILVSILLILTLYYLKQDGWAKTSIIALINISIVLKSLWCNVVCFLLLGDEDNFDELSERIYFIFVFSSGVFSVIGLWNLFFLETTPGIKTTIFATITLFL